MLWAVLHHDVCQLVVHVFLDTISRFFLVLSDLAKNLSLHRARWRECFTHRLGLEAYRRFSQYGGIHATRIIPRLGALLVAESQHLKTFDECV